MKKAISFAMVLCLVLLPSLILAGDVHVRGYYRKDGTYVRPHIRSSPDQYKRNNYGPSQNSYELMNPRTRDYDRDGIPNFRDMDSDNDGLFDDSDRNPFGRERW